jgi:hypothetical protein
MGWFSDGLFGLFWRRPENGLAVFSVIPAQAGILVGIQQLSEKQTVA